MIGLLGFAGLWALGRWRGWGAQWLWLAAGWWGLLMLVHLPMQVENPLSRVLGGDFRGWTVFGLLAAVALGYREVLRMVRRRKGTEPEAAPATGTFREAELDRYARHIILREIGGPGQKRLKAAKVLVVGAGGLGSPVLLYLAAAGVGTIGVIDHDVVEGSNLQRQVIHTDGRIGMPKVFSAEVAMRALNPFIEVRPYHRKLTEEIAVDLVRDYDLVLDGTDDFDTRYLVNRACVAAGVPLISGAITQWEGQISLFDPAKGGPCYACVFPVRPAPGLVPTCAEAGVAAPLPGVIGSMMAMEAVKWVTGAGETLAGRLMIHDALYMETRVIGVKKRADCEVCGGAH
ncbi:HesA/MoeB/ThiF family protein [Tabrizicola thermarum]|uniref:HesA/MoeB/ThiF family protein n=1 Tax=Tabrizicola thermarum TaxID=2670345 RepID=UPI000FFBB75C|nr:HesA/MoeB/ThiF family protein [Tabrizicola thermarum]